MGELVTPRDEAWSIVLGYLSENGKVSVNKTSVPEKTKYTLSRVLRSMEEMGLLYRDSTQAHTYYPTRELARSCSGVVLERSQAAN